MSCGEILGLKKIFIFLIYDGGLLLNQYLERVGFFALAERDIVSSTEFIKSFLLQL